MSNKKKIIRSLLAKLQQFLPGQSEKKLIILMYHRVGDLSSKPLTVAPSTFERELLSLQENGYVCHNEPFAVKQNQVILTFDDGYEDFYLNVFPLLKEYDLPAILFICPNIIDNNLEYNWDKKYFVGQNNNKLSWEQLSEMKDSGLVEIGAHTMNHPDLDTMPAAEAEKEIRTSKEILEKKLGINCRYFAYPRGRFNKAVVKIVANSGFEYSFSTIYGSNTKKTNPHLLKRYMIEGSDSLFVFKNILKGALNILALQNTLVGNKIKRLLVR
jgi:peptidoglycan/xylan/chitin deacetylase (PgdA/CDA1 family)